MSVCKFIKSIQQRKVLISSNPGSTIQQNHSGAQLRLLPSKNLGSGTYGKVYQGTLVYFEAMRERQCVGVAVKIGLLEDTLMELIVGCVLNSIPKYKSQCLVRPLAYVLSPEAPNFVAIVYPLGQPIHIESSIIERGPLEHVLKPGSPSAVKAMDAFITAVRNLHRLGFAHMDIKIDNTIYIDDPADPDDAKGLYVIDYGCAEHLTYGNFSKSITCCGTIPFVSPEFLLCQAYQECAEQDLEDLLQAAKTFFKAQHFRGIQAQDFLESFAQNDRYTIKPPKNWRCDPLKHDTWSLGMCLLLLARGYVSPQWNGLLDATVMPRELWDVIPSVCTLVMYMSKHVCNSRPKLCEHRRNKDGLWFRSGASTSHVEDAYKIVCQQASPEQSNTIVAVTTSNGVAQNRVCQTDPRDTLIRINAWILCVRRLCLTWESGSRSDVATLQRVFHACFDKPFDAAAKQFKKPRQSPLSSVLLSRVMNAVSSIVVQVCSKQGNLSLLPEQMHLRINTQIMAQVISRLPRIFNQLSKHRILCLNILATCLENSVKMFVNAIDKVLQDVPLHLQNRRWFRCAAESCGKADQIMQLVYWLFEYSFAGAVSIASRMSSSMDVNRFIKVSDDKRLLFVPWNSKMHVLYPGCVEGYNLDNTFASRFHGDKEQGTYDIRPRVQSDCQQNIVCQEWLSSLTTRTYFGNEVPDENIAHCAYHATLWCILCSGPELHRLFSTEPITQGSTT